MSAKYVGGSVMPVRPDEHDLVVAAEVREHSVRQHRGIRGAGPIAATWVRKQPTAAALRARGVGVQVDPAGPRPRHPGVVGLGPVPGPDRVLQHR